MRRRFEQRFVRRLALELLQELEYASFFDCEVVIDELTSDIEAACKELECASCLDCEVSTDEPISGVVSACLSVSSPSPRRTVQGDFCNAFLYNVYW